MTLTTVFVILFGHWVADFVFQSDEMAVNKSKSNMALSAHVVAYTGVMTVFAAILFWPLIDKNDSVAAFKVAFMSWLAINFILHWITDYFTSRINSWLWQNERRHDFFVSIGFDQFIHYVCLFWTYEWIMR